jgi:AraC family transcriptional regulator
MRRYAVFTHTEHVSAIPQTMDTILVKWAPNSGLKLDSSPMFEQYTSEFNPNTGYGGTEFWIPLAS